MSRQFKLAIVRARNDTNVAPIPDRACRQVLMIGPQSVLRYWADTTDGWLDFLDSAMFPWVDISIAAADMSRVTQAQRAFDALRAANPGFDPLAGFDGAFVITHPGRMTIPNPMAGQPGQPATIVAGFDGGSTTVAGLPTAVIPVMPSDHTFMCHELGHVLGFVHTFGLDNNGTDWNPGDATVIVGPEYGSPYDLMSSASFGSRWLGTGPFWTASPTFAGDPVPDWPAQGAFSMGPNMSRANLHLSSPESLDPDHTDHRPLPTGGGIGRARLSPASANGGGLLVLHPPGEPPSGVGRVYVEYRDHRGWDRGLDVFGDDLARAGVVVHTVEDTAAGARAWYRGSIVTGAVDTDLVVAGRPLVVTLEDFDDDERWAEISYREAPTRAVTIRQFHLEDIILGGNPIREEQTPCGETITWGAWSTLTQCQYEVSTTGFGGEAPSTPAVTWTASGVPLTPPSGTAQVPFDDVTLPLEYTIDPVSFELSVASGGGLRFNAEIVATATLGAETASASTTFRAGGFFEGYTPEDEDVLSRCLKSILDRANIPRQAPRFRFPGPAPGRLPAEWREGALRRLRDLDLDPATASALERLIVLQVPQ